MSETGKVVGEAERFFQFLRIHLTVFFSNVLGNRCRRGPADYVVSALVLNVQEFKASSLPQLGAGTPAVLCVDAAGKTKITTDDSAVGDCLFVYAPFQSLL